MQLARRSSAAHTANGKAVRPLQTGVRSAFSLFSYVSVGIQLSHNTYSNLWRQKQLQVDSRRECVRRASNFHASVPGARASLNAKGPPPGQWERPGSSASWGWESEGKEPRPSPRVLRSTRFLDLECSHRSPAALGHPQVELFLSNQFKNTGAFI